ncbi:MAG: MFS transporter [Gammaproteobacteria bacterium]|nr:MFS transporter [Gammaproteobacteria bacterium]
MYFFTNGMTIFVPPNLFPRLMEEFSLNAGEISRSMSITFLGSAFMAPLVGMLIDRYGVLRVIRIGLVVLGICFACYPFATSLDQIYVLHGFFALGLVLCGLMPNVVLLSQWFVRYRGAVIGLLSSASSLAGGVLPLAIAPLVLNPEYGWRWGYGSLAVAFTVFALLPGMFWLKASPAEVGEYPDGREDSRPPEDGSKDGIPFRIAIRTVTLWALALSSACLWYSFNAMNNQATIFFEQEAGLAPADATLLYSIIFWCALAGKFTFGALSDIFAKQRVMLLTTILLFIGCCLVFELTDNGLGLATDQGQLTIFAVVFGLGYGGVFTMIQLVCVEVFGQRDLGKILGMVIFLDSLGAALGTWLTSYFKTTSGSYLMPFVAVTTVALVAIIGVLLIRPVKVPDYSTVPES